MHGVIPDLPEGGVVSPPSSTLCATTRWPSAMTDRGCAQRLDDIRPRRGRQGAQGHRAAEGVGGH
jgi:hypothetical protein